jgi:hypothetical protein
MAIDMDEDHFTDNEDLLERYVLGRLPEQDRQRYEHHLRRCEICQRAVRDEQGIAAGARQLGREQLKERVRGRVAAGGSAHFPWQRIAGIAALLVIITGIGIVYRWWEVSRLQQKPAMTEFKSEERPATGAEQQPPAASEANPIVPSPKYTSSTAGSSAKSVEPDKLRKRKPEGRLSAKESTIADEATSKNIAERSTAQNTLQGAANRAAREDALGIVQPQDQQTSQQFWLEGVVLAGPARSGPRTPEVQTLRLEKQKYDKDREIGADKKSGRPMNAAATEFAVSQEPMRALPSARQQQIVSARRTVVTLVQQEDGQTSLTLYLDSLVDDRELKAARVEYVTPDSVILHISDRRIGYKMPPIWSKAKSSQTQISR